MLTENVNTKKFTSGKSSVKIVSDLGRNKINVSLEIPSQLESLSQINSLIELLIEVKGELKNDIRTENPTPERTGEDDSNAQSG